MSSKRKIASLVIVALFPLFLYAGPAGTKKDTTTTLTSSANPSVAKSPVTFTATVSPSVATGSVTFKDGAKVLGVSPMNGGKASFSTAALTVADHSITASYSGDKSFNSSTSPALTQGVITKEESDLISALADRLVESMTKSKSEDQPVTLESEEKAAAAGDANAVYYLGVLYETDTLGFEVKQDYQQARQWFEKAAAAGNANAMDKLGDVYDAGEGVPQDYQQAHQWYEKAAAAGECKCHGQPRRSLRRRLWSAARLSAIAPMV